MEDNVRRIRPQAGYQMKSLSSPADIIIGGGAAGSGKTYSLLLEFLRNINVRGFGGVIFRRTSPQIRSEGGLWDTSMNIYPYVGAKPRESTLEWLFRSGVKLKFSHLEHEKNTLDWQGSQIPFIGFDELTHFSESMFFYLLGRNRSVCGVKPYVRATCNPDPDSWVARLIDWWIDPITGFPIPERDGVVRYFVRNGSDYIWGDTFDEVAEKADFILAPYLKKADASASDLIKSITFVSGSIYDNKELLRVDPGYLGNLISQDEQQKSQLLDGNWKIVISDNDIYEYPSFLGCFENNITVTTGKRYITADIALEGSNKLIIGVWDGFELIDVVVLDKSDGKLVEQTIKDLAKKYKVPNANIAYDSDGVGGYIKGYIVGAKAFNNNGAVTEVKINGKRVKPNYQNQKTQCYYESGKRVKDGGYRISEHVASKMYDDKMTMRQRFLHERKAIKKGPIDNDKKLTLIPKKEMKAKLNNESPDCMDMFMMREVFELLPPVPKAKTY